MILTYCIMVTGPAYGNQRASIALQFSKNVLEYGHKIKTIFFYKNGVYNANRFTAPASDEFDIVRAWSRFSKKNNVSIHVCISAALRRGITDAKNAYFIKNINNNIALNFKLSSLGYLAESILICDRFIQF